MNTRLLEIIRGANREFQAFIEEVSQNGPKLALARGTSSKLNRIALHLSRVERALAASGRPPAETAEAGYELSRYRETLKALKTALETFQFSLLAQKSHLENVQANMQAARAWADSIRQIS